MRIGDFSVRNSVLINILTVSLLVLGIFSILRMPREQYSEVPFYWVNILVLWPGVSAAEVEQQITIPIEKEMQGLDELDDITSISTEGSSAVGVRFDTGISQDRFDKLFNDVNTRLAKVKLPEGALSPTAASFSSNDFIPVIEVVLSGDVGYAALVRPNVLLTPCGAGPMWRGWSSSAFATAGSFCPPTVRPSRPGASPLMNW